MDFKIYEEEMLIEVENVYTYINNSFNKLRTGRVSAKYLDNILVDYYGEKTPIQHVANISTPDAKTLIIKPYERAMIKEIARAINASGSNINPQSDAEVVRLSFPPMTEDARKQTVKEAKAITEEAKVRVRKIRQNLQTEFKNEDNVQEDDKKYFQSELDRLTKEINANIDKLYHEKEKQIMTI